MQDSDPFFFGFSWAVVPEDLVLVLLCLAGIIAGRVFVSYKQKRALVGNSDRARGKGCGLVLHLGPHAGVRQCGTGHTLLVFTLIIMASLVRGRRGAVRAVRPVDHRASPRGPSTYKICPSVRVVTRTGA